MVMRYLLPLFLLLPVAAADALRSDNAELEQRLEPLKQAAEAGDPAQTRQVYLHYGFAGMQEQAEAWAAKFLDQLRERAEAGDLRAMNTLGRAYLLGDACIVADPAQALLWYTRAADAGDADSAYMLGNILEKQQQSAQAKQAYARAYGLYRREAERDNKPEPRFRAAYMQLMGQGVPADPAAATAELERLAGEHYLPALYQLFRHYTGAGNEPAAFACARRLADEGQDAQMAYVVADAYLKGKGVAANPEEGGRWLARAVEAGIPAAQYHRAWELEQEGKDAEAYPLYSAAAAQGNADAAIRAGKMLLEGRGTDRDDSAGLAYLQRACDAYRSPIAPYELGLYYDGVGERRLADSWYSVASDRGLVEAMPRRGLLHLDPFSEQAWSPTETYRWWKIAADAGDATARLYLRLYLWVFTPLLLLLVFGMPILLVHWLKRRAER